MVLKNLVIMILQLGHDHQGFKIAWFKKNWYSYGKMIACYSCASSSFNSIFGKQKLSLNKYDFKVTSFSKKENIFLGKIL
jgi:hypothetical protein